MIKLPIFKKHFKMQVYYAALFTNRTINNNYDFVNGLAS